MNFIILAAGRSGSTLLANCLSSHPKVRCHHEPFNQNGWHKELKGYKKPIDALSHLDSEGLSIPAYKKVLSLVQNTIGIHKGSIVVDPFKKNSEISAEGFKLTWVQASGMLNGLRRWLIKKNELKCIFLYRQDYLARYVSYQLAQDNQLWNSSHKSHDARPFKVSAIRFKQFYDRELMIEKRLWVLLAASNIHVSLLSYEELVENPLEKVNSELAFLDCDSLHQLKVSTTKLVATPLDELVINFDLLDSQKKNDLAHEQRLKWAREAGAFLTN